MKFCSKKHPEIVYNYYRCPLCENIKTWKTWFINHQKLLKKYNKLKKEMEDQDE